LAERLILPWLEDSHSAYISLTRAGSIGLLYSEDSEAKDLKGWVSYQIESVTSAMWPLQ
jgi:hypothetical protein